MGRSSYPSVLDSDVELSRVEDNITEIGSDAINSLRDAVFAIEGAIGLEPQGERTDLATRIGQSIDEEGRIKTSALAERGLVTLPINDGHIDDDAAIQESKLDLDYTTTYLNGRISSNVTDIDALRDAFNAFAAQTSRHFAGTGNRHDGYHIDLVNPMRSSDDVETALNVINNAFTEHENSVTGAHTAYGISVIDEFINFTASNVQDALVELDNMGSVLIETHQDRLHDTAVALNTRGEQGSQGNLVDSVLAGTIFQTETSKATNIFQVMRPNVARVTGKTPDLRALENGSSQYLRIQAGGVDRSSIDVNLSAILPTDDLDEVVRAINTACQGCEEHYPIAAYNVNGRLVVAHTIPGKPFTVQILDTVQFSAATALGFADVAGEVIEWANNAHAGYVGGQRVVDLKPLIKRHHNHTNRHLNTIALGLGSLTNYGLSTDNEGRILCNITNHSANSEDNGTHYIIGFPNDETFVLSADITNGEFDIEIPADAVNFSNSANGELYDIFVEADSDGYGIVTKSNRVSYGPIAGLNLKSITKDFPTSDVEWRVTNANSVTITVDGDAGVATEIPTGYQGELKVFAPDNVNSALFEVTGVPSSAGKTMDVSEFAGTDDRLHIGSVQYAGNLGLSTIKYAMDKRKLGASIENKAYDELDPLPLEDTIGEIRNNGVIRGLDVISSDGTSFKIRGGRALVAGRVVDVETQNVTVSDFGASSKLVLLNRHGNFIIVDEFESGFTFEELTSGDAYGDERGVAIICEFETDGSEISGGFMDRRLMVSNIDKRLLDAEASLNQQITELRNSIQGSMWGFTVASASALDGYLSSIEPGDNWGFSYVPWAGQTPTSARGFTGGSALITDRKFEFSEPDIIQTSVFRPTGMTHINVFLEASYTGNTAGQNGPFGVSGTVYIQVGVAAEVGMGTSLHIYDDYATVKTLYTGVLPTKEQTERYVASIAVSRLGLPENVMFDVVPRVRIVNSNYVDGGPGGDPESTIRFDHVRIVTSSYSIAADINEEDGANSSSAATVGHIL